MTTVESPLLRSDSQETSLEGVRRPLSSQERQIPLQSISWKVLAVYWTFLVMGASDAAYGPLIPSFELYYGLSYTTVSLLFLSPVCGYMLAAILNNEVHVRLGRRGIACIHSICHLSTFVVVSLHPPYPVLVVTLMIGGIGNGLADSGWNAWIGAMANSHELLGMMHGLYGVGAVVSPSIATVLMNKAHLPWFRFYNLMAACALIETVTIMVAFWDSGPDEYQIIDNPEETHGGGLRQALFRRPYARVTWTSAFYFVVYMGVEVSIGGWTVTYLIRVRDGDPFSSGMAATGFWLGLALGRFILGFVTSRLGQILAITVYSLAVIIFGVGFWLLPNFIAAAVAVSLQGFFLGPLFPSIIVVVTKILPQELHVSSIGFASAVGGAGAALLPFTVGAMAQATGVGILPRFIVATSGGLFALWLYLAPMLKHAKSPRSCSG